MEKAGVCQMYGNRYEEIITLCRGCKNIVRSFVDEPCKSCTVRPSNFEERNENQSDEIS
jgi:hypothetical protein